MNRFIISAIFFALLHFFADSIFAQNYVSTFTGQGVAGFVNGPLDSASFNNPFGLCRDRMGNIFIADGNNSIRKIDFASGFVSTYAGNGIAGYKDGPADSAQFNAPSDLCVDDSGNVYVCDFQNQRIRKIDINGMVTTVAGNGLAGYVDGSVNARFNYPRGICRDISGNLFIGDSWNHRIRKIDLAGNVTTYAGGGSANGVGSVGAYVDGVDTSARFYTPAGLCIDTHGNIYVADAYNHRVRMVDTAGTVSTIAGSGATGQGNGGYMNGIFSSSILNTPTELYFDTIHERLYISDTFNNRIRIAEFATTSVLTLAGNGVGGYVNDIDSLAEFNFPRGLAVDSSGDVYLCDYNNHSIRLISTNSTTSLNEISLENIIIYPNPATAFFNIEFIKACQHTIKLCSNSGKLLETILTETLHAEINVAHLKKGFYFALIFSDDEYIGTVKLIKY